MTVLAFAAAISLLQVNALPPVPLAKPPVPVVVRALPVAPNPSADDNIGNWTYPSAETGQAAYPMRALDDGVGAVVTIDCVVDVTGKLTTCDMVSETPPGYGFGAATMKLFTLHCFVDPKSVPGGIIPGSRRLFTYKWVP